MMKAFKMLTAQHSTAQHSTAQHSTAQHSTAQHSTALAEICNNIDIYIHGVTRGDLSNHSCEASMI